MAELVTTLVGTASIKSATDPVSIGAVNVSLKFVFSGDRTTVEIREWAPIAVGPFAIRNPVPLLPPILDTVTVTKKSGAIGLFDLSNGSMSIPITLHFTHSALATELNDVPLVLTTGAATSPAGAFNEIGSPLNRSTREIRLVAASRIQGGIVLNGKDCSVVLTGTLTSNPFITEPQFILHKGTALQETDDRFAFAMVDWNGDGSQDLVAIQKSATGTNSTEVHVLSG
ncbi:MAG: hypothetical protein QOK16_3323 [Solirubrobacteraceae bacterium]|nr:hypothetical protein [Solirubrobacteraceae bacterium]